MMNEESAEDIGNIIGKFVEADTGIDGNAIGRFLRIKVRMLIDKPIMRGFTLDDGAEKVDVREKGKVATDSGEEEEDGDWCRFEYEHLSDFCFTCGVIGHGEKDCVIKLKKGERPQFERWLRADLGQRRGIVEEGHWRSGGRNLGGSRNYGYSRSGGRPGSGSDSLSWRKSDSRSSEDGDGRSDKGEEVTSPAKINNASRRTGNPKRLELGDGATKNKSGSTMKESALGTTPTSSTKDTVMVAADKGTGPEVDIKERKKGEDEEVGEKSKNTGGKRYKKKGRDRVVAEGDKAREAVLGQKRGRVGEEVEKLGKKGKADEVAKDAVVESNIQDAETNDKISAGLLEQPRREQ